MGKRIICYYAWTLTNERVEFQIYFINKSKKKRKKEKNACSKPDPFNPVVTENTVLFFKTIYTPFIKCTHSQRCMRTCIIYLRTRTYTYIIYMCVCVCRNIYEVKGTKKKKEKKRDESLYQFIYILIRRFFFSPRSGLG